MANALDCVKHLRIYQIVKDHFEFWFVVCIFIVIMIVGTQTTFTILDLQVQTFLLRMLHSTVTLFVVIELFRSTGYIDNYRLSKIVWNMTKWLFIYFLARIIAGVLDSWLGYSIGWLSNNVQLAFWIVVYLKIRKSRMILGSSKNTEQRIALRKTVDALLNQLETAKENTQRVLDAHQQ